MQKKTDETWSAMRREVARQNEAWARAKEEFASGAGPRPIPVEVEWFGELDRACDVSSLPASARKIQNLALRA
jgi:hypothetical protein